MSSFQIEYINSHSRDWKEYGPKMGKTAAKKEIKELSQGSVWKYRVIRADTGEVVWPEQTEEGEKCRSDTERKK